MRLELNMKCEKCGGLVTWRGPLSALTHTECESCGGINCQVVECENYEEDGDKYQNDLQAASGGLCQTAMEW